jgi:hypothetical protein
MRTMQRFAVVLSLLLLAHAAAAVQTCTDPPTNCRSQGHATIKGSLYPYSEDIAGAGSVPVGNVTVTGPNSPWVIVSTGCVDVNQNNLFPGSAFNLRMLAYLQIGAATVAPGGSYEMQFLIDGVTHGWFVRAYKGMLPQGDFFGSVVANLPAGTHKFEVQVRVLAAGYLKFVQQWATSMGAPTSFPFVTDTAAPAMTIDNTWRQVTDQVTFTNSVAADLFPQAYLQWNSGTSGDNVTVKFVLDGAEPPHNSDVAVPPYFRDGVHIFDDLKNVPAGTHTISLWAKNNLAHTASVSFRTIEVASYPAASAHPANPAIADNIAFGAVTVNPSIASAEQPAFGAGCGYWTKLLELDLPPVAGPFMWTGAGYVRLLGNRTGDWSTTRVEVAIEAIALGTTPAVSDMGWVAVSAPNSQGQIYLFSDSMLWGNAGGQKIKLWIRKVAGCGYSTGTFDVGRRYLALKLVPTDWMYCFNN